MSSKSKCDSCKGCEDKNKLKVEEEFEAIIEECSNYKKDK